ncbi:MAG: hypothetical protein JNJ54_36735 [Myxococcaceae bacterium]|nr:hypothetical protein [Myxococcaceae bacterium]
MTTARVRWHEEQDSFERIAALLARDVDGAQIDANLRLSAEERLLKLEAMMRFTEEARSARSRHSCRGSSTQ